MILRPYQPEGVDAILAALQRSRSALYVLPTGGGKTVILAELARRMHSFEGWKTLLLVHRRELIHQAVKTMREACPDVTIGIEAAGFPRTPWADLFVGMVQSLVRRDTPYLKPDLVVVDEAHHARAASYEKVLARWPDAFLGGLTATPQRLDGLGLGTHFNEMVLGPTAKTLIEDGYLADVRLVRIPLVNRHAFRKDRHGEYRADDVAKTMTDKTVAAAAEAYMRYAPGRRAIYFGWDRENSKKVCARLRELGVAAEHVDGTDHQTRRDRVMNGLREGALSVVGNCELISEGFDAPGCDCVIVGYPTRSITKWLQMLGRMMRPGPGKTALGLDLGGSSWELGLPQEDREWSLEDGEVKPKKKKRDNLRTCSQCQTAYRTPPCPFCGHWPQSQREGFDEADLELEEATPTKTKNPVRALHVSS